MNANTAASLDQITATGALDVTAAGKVPPAKVLVVGAGVAGLAAIGTATSLGAITYAFDVRPEVAEQVESMGAEFVYLDFEEEQQDGAGTGGYGSVSSPEFAAAQLAKFREIAQEMDIVITTALIPNRDAPILWTKDMVEMMKPGSVIVDLAAERGGTRIVGDRVGRVGGQRRQRVERQGFEDREFIAAPGFGRELARRERRANRGKRCQSPSPHNSSSNTTTSSVSPTRTVTIISHRPRM